jgi:membrane protease YdiL (CAAX protease family)
LPLPFALIGIWILLTAVIVKGLMEPLFNDASEMANNLAQYGSIMGIDLFVIGLAVWFSHACFARGIRGLGIHSKTLARDLGWAFINLLTVYPLVILAAAAVVYAGKTIMGPGFRFQENPALTDISASNTWIQTFLLSINAIVIIPVFEEMIFRGMLQTVIRSYLDRVWPAILITSALFAALHPPMHWPAIFVLSCAMGYTYEKSGSLIRCILVHVLFNGVNVITSMFLQ